MKTLIINGSPKKSGDTDTLLQHLRNKLKGEIIELNHYSGINPCNDCRYCWENSACTIDDKLQSIYPFIQECDNVIFASPIWFSSLSGPILTIGSRFQRYWASNYFRNEIGVAKEKKGAIIIVGAEPGTQVTPAKNAETIMKFINVNRSTIRHIYSLDTNNLKAGEDLEAISAIDELSVWMNQSATQNQDKKSLK